MNLETSKVNAIQSELDQERVNVNAVQIELAKEKAIVEDIKTQFEHQKAALDHEISCHNATKRLVYDLQCRLLSSGPMNSYAK